MILNHIRAIMNTEVQRKLIPTLSVVKVGLPSDFFILSQNRETVNKINTKNKGEAPVQKIGVSPFRLMLKNPDYSTKHKALLGGVVVPPKEFPHL